VTGCSKDSLQTRLIKIGQRIVRQARAITFQLAGWPSMAPWSGSSLTPSADCERHRHARDPDTDRNRTKAAGQVFPTR